MKQCVDNFRNITPGKVVQFGSLYSFVDDFVSAGKSSTEALIVKGVTFWAFFKGADSNGLRWRHRTGRTKPFACEH